MHKDNVIGICISLSWSRYVLLDLRGEKFLSWVTLLHQLRENFKKVEPKFSVSITTYLPFVHLKYIEKQVIKQTDTYLILKPDVIDDRYNNIDSTSEMATMVCTNYGLYIISKAGKVKIDFIIDDLDYLDILVFTATEVKSNHVLP